MNPKSCSLVCMNVPVKLAKEYQTSFSMCCYAVDSQQKTSGQCYDGGSNMRSAFKVRLILWDNVAPQLVPHYKKSIQQQSRLAGGLERLGEGAGKGKKISTKNAEMKPLARMLVVMWVVVVMVVMVVLPFKTLLKSRALKSLSTVCFYEFIFKQNRAREVHRVVIEIGFQRTQFEAKYVTGVRGFTREWEEDRGVTSSEKSAGPQKSRKVEVMRIKFVRSMSAATWRNRIRNYIIQESVVVQGIDFELPELMTGTLKSEIEVCESNSFKICDLHPIKEEHEPQISSENDQFVSESESSDSEFVNNETEQELYSNESERLEQVGVATDIDNMTLTCRFLERVCNFPLCDSLLDNPNLKVEFLHLAQDLRIFFESACHQLPQFVSPGTTLLVEDNQKLTSELGLPQVSLCAETPSSHRAFSVFAFFVSAETGIRSFRFPPLLIDIINFSVIAILCVAISESFLLNYDKASNHQITWVPFNGLTKFLPDLAEQAVLLQVVREKCLFALDVTSLSENIQNQIEKKLNGKFINLRKSLFTLSAEESVLVSQGKSLLSWVKSNCFCPTCGGELVLRGAGRAHKECGSCKSVQYPTISPVGIVLVTDIAHTNALLVRQPVHPPGMYTCIAGFVEVGESVEENIKREVAEEVGLEVVDIKYFGSQHWAFPASRLMIGCLATVSEHQFSLDRSELEDAAWFTPQEVRGALNRVSKSRESVFSESKELFKSGGSLDLVTPLSELRVIASGSKECCEYSGGIAGLLFYLVYDKWHKQPGQSVVVAFPHFADTVRQHIPTKHVFKLTIIYKQ
uniref:NAD(+) diphosphatase n=1 Tax=Timema cristinae TaxID=61476 RepID=A0A7R9CFG0_TIMCR|nr:unnamed protein product [Timema cristinae]